MKTSIVSREYAGKMRVALWSEPGLGVEPEAELLEKFCIDRVKL